MELSPLESPRAAPVTIATPLSAVRAADTSVYYTAEKVPMSADVAAHTPDRLFPARSARSPRWA